MVRISGVLLGSLLLFPGLYGLWGLGAILEQWQMCQRSTAVAAQVATSYPADFCLTRDWIAAILPGIGLLGVGIAGIGLIVASVRLGRSSA